MTEIKTVCGHPRGCIVQDAEGMVHCAWCEEVAQLREELGRSSERYNEAQLQLSKLREEGVTVMAGGHWVAKAEWNECRAEVARLRELIPDAGMLNWLVKAAHRWWKDNGGVGTQKEIEAGYALVKELYREANVDET